MRPALGKFQTSAGDEVRYNSRNENFAGLSRCHDSGCGMHRDAADIPASDFNLACMETSAERQADLP